MAGSHYKNNQNFMIFILTIVVVVIFAFGFEPGEGNRPEIH
jgi:hypothetical protein